MIVPFWTESTVQPWWVQMAENPCTVPPGSRVSTTCCPARTTPPLAGTWSTEARSRPPVCAPEEYPVLAFALATELFWATKYPATPAAAVTTSPLITDRRDTASEAIVASVSSGQRKARAGEEPQRSREPDEHEQPEHAAAERRQRPPGNRAQPQ